MRTRPAGLLLAALGLFFGGSSVALAARTDVIVLRNGDQITGEVLQMRQGKLQVKTDDAGTLSIKWDKVASVTTAASYDVTMRDTRRLFGRLRAAAAGSLDLVADDGSVTTIPAADIVWFVQIKNSFWSRFEGSVDLGGSYTRSSGIAAYPGSHLHRSAGLAIVIPRRCGSFVYRGWRVRHHLHRTSLT